MVHKVFIIGITTTLLQLIKIEHNRINNIIMKRKIFFGFLSLIVLVSAIGFTTYLVESKPAPIKDSKTVNTMYVKATKANMSDIESDMIYRGRVTAYDNVSLSAEVTGMIMQGDVRFKAGESFIKGQTLIKIYDEDVIASLKSGKSSLLQTVSKILPDIKIDYPKQYEKWYSFFAKINPEKSLPDLPKIVTDKERVYLASNNVLTSYYSLQQQEIKLTRYTLRAPFTGFFKSVNKEIGAVASPGSELANLIRSDKLEIVVPVFPDDLKWITKDDKVRIIDNDGNMQTAKVSRIAGFVDISTQSVNVYLTYCATEKNTLLEGEYVNVSFAGVKLTGFEIPREAIVDDSYVYEIVDNKLEKTKVDIVRNLDDTTIITGIDSTQIIVTESLASVNTGIKYLAR